MVDVVRIACSFCLALSVATPAIAQDRVTLGFDYHGALSADQQSLTQDPELLATAAWVDSVRVFLGPEVLQLQEYGWYPVREGESPNYLTQIVGLPVMGGSEPTGLVVLAVTVLASSPDDQAWRYVGQSVEYYEGNAREAVPRIIDTLSRSIEADRAN
jgi:hypothetical protein